MDTSCNHPQGRRFYAKTLDRRITCNPHEPDVQPRIPCVDAAQKCQSCKQLHPRGRREASLRPGILASQRKEPTMATPTEHRANIITQDLTRAEDLTRRQYAIAAEIAAQAGAANPTVVTGVLAALALNFATLHNRPA
jgi:hypothetical protein